METEGTLRAEGRETSRPQMDGDSSRGARAALTVDGILDLNLMGRVLHSSDSFLPGSSLPVMSSRRLNSALDISLQSVLSQGAGE